MISSRETSIIMPLVVTKTGTHEEAIAAVAVAAAIACLAAPSDEEIWTKWYDDNYGKTVRRANSKDFPKLSQRAEVVASHTVGEAQALAFTPISYEDMDGRLRRLQVGGTEYERSPSEPNAEAATIFLNGGLNMSTGKSAAQAAHALTAWCDSKSASECEQWLSAGSPVNVVELSSGRFTVESEAVPRFLLIRDAGHTEIERGSATAFVK